MPEMILGMEEIPFSPANLETKRESLELTRKHVADATGISESALYHYEKGTKEPGVKKLTLIGLYFSRVQKMRVKFVCEWDDVLVNEYAALNLSDLDVDKFKAALKNE